ncbi:hypothetical protein KEJ39_05530 [Candidatus Bathyarchaeota archaeon]|nr:hypothetical protein [Candidatus Bathyarchaeota archaeon]
MSILDITSFIIHSSPGKASKNGGFTASTFIYWSRFGVAVLAALLCYFLQLKGSSGLSMAAFIYLLTVIVVRRLYYSVKELQTGRKTVMLGLGTYIFTWATIWIFLYTLRPYP